MSKSEKVILSALWIACVAFGVWRSFQADAAFARGDTLGLIKFSGIVLMWMTIANTIAVMYVVRRSARP